MNYGQLNNAADHRKADFKKTVDATEGRRRRADTTLKIRKEKKEQLLKKKRDGVSTTTQQMDVAFTNSFNQQPAAINISGGKDDKPTMVDAPRFMAMLMSPVSTEPILVEATQGIRRILSVEKNVPARELINMGVLPYLVRNLSVRSGTSSITLIFESAWAITNIASTECTGNVVEAGAIKPLIYLLDHPEVNIREQSAWCLGNIAGEGPVSRDMILHDQALPALLRNLIECEKVSHLGIVVWTISNLCRGTPSPPTHVTAPVIFPFVKLLEQSIPDDVKVDALWCLSYLSDGDEQKIAMVAASGVAPKLVQLLGNDDVKNKCKVPVVRTLGNFVAGSEDQTQVAIDAGILNHLARLLGSSSKMIRKEASWLTSNMAAGSRAQISMLMKKTKIISKIIKIAQNDLWEVRKEALWAVAHICTSGSDSHIMSLVDVGGLQPLISVLRLQNIDSALLLVILEALGRILEVGTKFPHQNYVQLIDEYDGIECLEDLQTHPNDNVYQKVIELIENYLGSEEEGDENLAPVTNEAGTFGFGLASPKNLFTNFNATENSAPLPFGSVSANTFQYPV